MRGVDRTVWAVLFVLIGGALAEAASGDADGTYTVTVTQIEISRDSGSTYTTIFSGSQAINIAAANAGAAAAGLVSGVDLPDGTYDVVRTTLGANLLVKGYVNSGSDTIYTDNSSDNGSGTNSGQTNTPGSDYAVSTFTIPAANRTNTITGLSIAVQKDIKRTVRIVFNTSGVLTQISGSLVPGAPSVSITTP